MTSPKTIAHAGAGHARDVAFVVTPDRGHGPLLQGRDGLL